MQIGAEHFIMITDKIKELAAARSKVSQLEQVVAAERAKELAALPGNYGFDTVAAFIKAVRAASGKGRRKGKPGRGKRRKRVAITAEIKAKVKALAQEGKSGKEIVAATGISLPSVQNIKRELGLTKARK